MCYDVYLNIFIIQYSLFFNFMYVQRLITEELFPPMSRIPKTLAEARNSQSLPTPRVFPDSCGSQAKMKKKMKPGKIKTKIG